MLSVAEVGEISCNVPFVMTASCDVVVVGIVCVPSARCELRLRSSHAQSARTMATIGVGKNFCQPPSFCKSPKPFRSKKNLTRFDFETPEFSLSAGVSVVSTPGTSLRDACGTCYLVGVAEVGVE